MRGEVYATGNTSLHSQQIRGVRVCVFTESDGEFTALLSISFPIFDFCQFPDFSKKWQMKELVRFKIPIVFSKNILILIFENVPPQFICFQNPGTGQKI
jgi:hypothetical protein